MKTDVICCPVCGSPNVQSQENSLRHSLTHHECYDGMVHYECCELECGGHFGVAQKESVKNLQEGKRIPQWVINIPLGLALLISFGGMVYVIGQAVCLW